MVNHQRRRISFAARFQQGVVDQTQEFAQLLLNRLKGIDQGHIGAHLVQAERPRHDFGMSRGRVQGDADKAFTLVAHFGQIMTLFRRQVDEKVEPGLEGAYRRHDGGGIGWGQNGIHTINTHSWVPFWKIG